jgi:hypothetical protein
MGHFENSPAFQTPGFDGIASSPAGTAETGVRRVAGLVKTGSFQPSRWDSTFFQSVPGIEMPGYFRWFLRN